MLTYVTLSLFESPAQTLVNTVNTMGVMGKGIAATFKQLYPDMYREYRRLCLAGKLDIGKLYIYRTLNKIVVNFPTKRHWRERSRVEYIEAGLDKFVRRYTDFGISSVSFPQLGCGHGELNWERQVRPVMEHFLGRLPISVYIHLYAPQKATAFVPERLDVDYARQIRLERQRVSIDRLWQDLQALVARSGEPYDLTLFGPQVTVNGEHVFFAPTSGDPVIAYREDVEELWATLRLRGSIMETDLPDSIRREGAGQWLFDLLQRLPYVRPATLRVQGGHELVRGLRYVPLPEEPATDRKVEVLT